MKQKGFLFEVGGLVRDKQGTRIVFDIEEDLDIDAWEDSKAVSPFSAEITFMKIDGGIHVYIQNAVNKFEFNCTRCRKNFIKEIFIKDAQRVYFFEKQPEINDIFDVYYVDLKNMTIDIAEFVRQEIILHFPTIPVCSNSCKGLCPSCGADLNDGQCDCKPKRPKQEKPLAILKTLYNAKASSTEKEDCKINN